MNLMTMGGIFHWRLHLTGIVLRVQDGNVDLGREPGANVAGDTVCGESAGLRCAQPRDGQRRGFVERPAGPLDKTESHASGASKTLIGRRDARS